MIPRIFQGVMAENRSPEFSGESYVLEQYRGKNISVFSFSLFIVKIRLYSAVINDQLVVASRRDIVTDLIDATSTSRNTASGNLEFSVYRSAFREIEPTVSIGYQEDIRHACHKNLALAEFLFDTGGIVPADFEKAAFALRGYEPFCPSGGHYSLDPENNRSQCSLHGTIYRPIQPVASSSDAPTVRLMNSLKRSMQGFHSLLKD